MDKWTKSFVSFILWIGVVLVSFALAVAAIAASSVPRAVVAVCAVVIFAASLAVTIINFGAFSKQATASTGK